jgi:hypothetical protein
MIRWMREFNQSGKRHVEFTGFDMQNVSVAGPIVRDFAAKYDPDFAGTLAGEVHRLPTYRDRALDSEPRRPGTVPGPLLQRRFGFGGVVNFSSFTLFSRSRRSRM